MKAFVTGATGFLGSHLVDRLLEKGSEVHVLIRRESNLQWLLGKNITLHYGDLRKDKKGLREGLEGADVCFHVAGVISAPSAKVYQEANVQGTANLFSAILDVNPKVQKVVVVSSLAAHGPGQDDQPAREDDPCQPITYYGQSKLDEELVAFQYRDRIPVTIIRPPAIYGPRDRQVYRYFWMAKKGVLLLPGGEDKVINLAYVQDVVTGIVLVAENPKATGQIFFIGDEKNYNWETIALTIAASFGKKGVKIRIPIGLAALIAWGSNLFGRDRFKNFLARNWTLDIGKARSLLGYRPAFDLERGVRETADWYAQEGWL